MTLTFDQIGKDWANPPGKFFNTESGPAEPAIRGHRAFFGDARNHGQQTDGNVTGGSYLQSFTINSNGSTVTIDGLDYLEDLGRVVSVSNFGVAIGGASKTSGGQQAIGVFGLAINEDPTGLLSWGAYVEANRTHATAGQTIGLEVNVAQTPAASSRGAIGPYGTKGSDWTNVLRVAVGSDGKSTFPTGSVFPRSFAVNAGVTFANNGGAMWEGIVFDTDAIMREGGSDDRSRPGNTGYARAITMANEQGLSWFSLNALVATAGTFITGEIYIIQSVGTTNFLDCAELDDEGEPVITIVPPNTLPNQVGNVFRARNAGTGTGTATQAGSQSEVVRMYSSVANRARRWRAVWSDGSFDINEGVGTGSSLFRVAWRDDAASFIQVAAGDGSTVAPTISAQGVATNIPMTLSPKGTGWVAFGAIGNVRDYADDAAAAAGGLNVGAIYRTGSILKVRAA